MHERWTVRQGDCRDVMRAMTDASVDAVVSDPPYGLAFMGKGWDHAVPGVEFWVEALRVAKPGAHLVAFGGTRTFHRLAVAIEDAGWEVRDCLSWLYGSGFPKSLDVGKAHDRAAGALPPESVRFSVAGRTDQNLPNPATKGYNRPAPATDLARQWHGWGTALKPGHEPIVLAQKPYTPQQLLAILVPTTRELICKVATSEKTGTSSFASLQTFGFWSTAPWLLQCLDVLSNVASRCTTETASALTTDLKILKSSLSKITHDSTTVASSPTSGGESSAMLAAAISASVQAKCERLAATTAGEIAIDWRADEGTAPAGGEFSTAWEPIILARKPLTGTVAANVAQHGTGALNVDGCRIGTEVVGWQGARGGSVGRWPANVCLDEDAAAMLDEPSRFFYTAKASRREREAGLDGMPERVALKWNSGGIAERLAETARPLSNVHPTVKPIALMRWLCRLVTPPGGLVLDPFTGSGTTGCAAVLEGFRFYGAELDAEYAEIARRRIAYWAAHADADAKQPTQLDLAPLADADPPA
jgi:DNA modification methylase